MTRQRSETLLRPICWPLCDFYCDLNHLTPRWTESEFRKVWSEYGSASIRDRPNLHEIVTARWLGRPLLPGPLDVPGICQMGIALNGGITSSADYQSEAELLYIAEWHKAVVATDSRVVFDFACNRFGQHRVVDTVQILREAVAAGLFGPKQAVMAIQAIEASHGPVRLRDTSRIDLGYFGG
jgi:hypothetical protein